MLANRHPAAHRVPAWWIAAAFLLLCVSIEGCALSRNFGQPSNDGVRSYVLGELSDGLSAGQTFATRAPGLKSLTVYPRAITEDPIGLVTLELRDVTIPEVSFIVRRQTVPLRQIAAVGRFTMGFPPQALTGRRYELEFRVWGAPVGHGIGLLATRGAGYRDGTLVVDTRRRRSHDLAFDTEVEGAQTNFAVLASRLEAAGVPAAGVLLLLVLVLKNAALFLIIRSAGEWPDAPATPPSTQ